MNDVIYVLSADQFFVWATQEGRAVYIVRFNAMVFDSSTSIAKPGVRIIYAFDAQAHGDAVKTWIYTEYHSVGSDGFIQFSQDSMHDRLVQAGTPLSLAHPSSGSL